MPSAVKRRWYPPLGASVTMDANAAPLVVGYHGQLFIPDLRQAATGHVVYATGNCDFTLAVPPARADQGIPRIDPVLCEAGTAP